MSLSKSPREILQSDRILFSFVLDLPPFWMAFYLSLSLMLNLVDIGRRIETDKKKYIMKSEKQHDGSDQPKVKRTKDNCRIRCRQRRRQRRNEGFYRSTHSPPNAAHGTVFVT